MQKIKVKQVRSIIDRPLTQKRTVEALGLGRPNWEIIHNDTPQIRGMINKVSHLVEVSEYKSTDEEKAKTKTVPKKKNSTEKVSAKTKKTSSKTKKEN